MYSNIVKSQTLRETQLEALEIICDALEKSFGPAGSNTLIMKENMATKYSKDGHTILSNIYFQGQIENTVRKNLEDLTFHIVRTIGDGTTSAIILSKIIFEALSKINSKNPYKLVNDFKNTVNAIVGKIRSNSRECTLDDIYNITLIATNGNTEIAENIKTIYKDFGMDVFIDVNASTGIESAIKIYDGMTVEAGYTEECFANDTKGVISRIRGAKVYAFEDPIDTPEMIQLFDTIIYKNIYNKMQTDQDYTPTVIMCPKISKDYASSMDAMTEMFYKLPAVSRPPLLIISNIYRKDELMDIAKMCGCQMIKKYIDPNIQKMQTEQGLAPTIQNVAEKFFGEAEMVEADSFKTKFIKPKMMRDENNNPTQLFSSLLNFLENELKKSIDEGANTMVTGTLKRRINSLKGNLVEYFVGGISVSDRDSLRDLVEDAVLNCRSASRYGVGYGANYEGYKATREIYENAILNNKESSILFLGLIKKGYEELIQKLYRVDDDSIAKGMVEMKMPLNINTGKYDCKVLSSIETDVTILETISKIITIMVTCNQALCQSPMHNLYDKK